MGGRGEAKIQHGPLKTSAGSAFCPGPSGRLGMAPRFLPGATGPGSAASLRAAHGTRARRPGPPAAATSPGAKPSRATAGLGAGSEELFREHARGPRSRTQVDTYPDSAAKPGAPASAQTHPRGRGRGAQRRRESNRFEPKPQNFPTRGRCRARGAPFPAPGAEGGGCERVRGERGCGARGHGCRGQRAVSSRIPGAGRRVHPTGGWTRAGASRDRAGSAGRDKVPETRRPRTATGSSGRTRSSRTAARSAPSRPGAKERKSGGGGGARPHSP